MAGAARIGVDVGGTFTDLVLHDPARGLVRTGKLLTTPDDPSEAIIEGMQRILREAGLAPGDLHSIVHGTTLVTNTVIERTGAKVGLLTTAGFRDSIEIGREIRYDLYDLFLEAPSPLVPRHLRREIPGRLDADGAELLPLDEDAVAREVRALVEAEAIEALAIGFLHSYRDPRHEKRAGEIVRALYPDLMLTLSAEVAPEIREYERSSTACANAYVQPRMRRYLDALEVSLARIGFDGRLYVMLSGGGIAAVREAKHFPIRLIESGPAAGAMAAAFLAKLAGLDHVVSYDMGGTTAKMCLIEDGVPDHKFDFEAGRVRRFVKGSGLPLKVSVVDMIEVGAGGGSIARIEPGSGLMKVGPRSAGAAPGPVCYGRGGTEPCVTDADLLLGRLDPAYFLGGEMALDPDRVHRAFADGVAAALRLAPIDAALGVQRIVDETMAAATRMHLAEKGRDPRDYTLIAFGGAGPGPRLEPGAAAENPPHHRPARRRRRLRPRLPRRTAGDRHGAQPCRPAGAPGLDGGECAVRRHGGGGPTAARGSRRRPGSDHPEAHGRHAPCRPGLRDPRTAAGLALSDADIPAIRRSFFDSYRERFGRVVEDQPIEALSWRLACSAPGQDIRIGLGGGAANAGGKPIPRSERPVTFEGHGALGCPVYDRYALRPGMGFDGPALVEERESTCVVGPATRVTVDGHLNLVLELQ
jgi:N-methylhydantoinase A